MWPVLQDITRIASTSAKVVCKFSFIVLQHCLLLMYCSISVIQRGGAPGISPLNYFSPLPLDFWNLVIIIMKGTKVLTLGAGR